MNQKVLYSMMGLAALPLGAEAAVVQEFQQTNWQGTDLTIENGVIFSTGAEVTYSLGKLVPGNYEFTCSVLSRIYEVEINIGGTKFTSDKGDAAQDLNVPFKLTEETQVTLSIKTTGRENTIGAGAEFSVANPKIELLDTDITNAKQTLVDAAQDAQAILNGYTYEKAEHEATLAGIIATINGIEVTYADYKTHELYLVADEKSTIQKNIAALLEKAKEAQAAFDEANRVAANNAQYNKVNEAINAAKSLLANARAALADVLVDAAAYLNGDATEALDALNEKISGAVAENLQKLDAYTEAGEYSDAEADAIKDSLPTEAEIQAVVDQFTGLAQAAIASYDNLMDRVTQLQQNLDGVSIDPDVAAQFTAQKQAAQDAINAIKAKVEGIYGKSDPDLLDITGDAAAAQDLIDKLAADAAEASAEFDANAASVIAITDAQNHLNEALEALEGLMYGDVAVISKYTTLIGNLQTQIDKLTEEAADAYANGKAQDYNANLNTTALEAAIALFAEKSIAAFEHYELLFPVIEAYYAQVGREGALREKYYENKDAYDWFINNADHPYDFKYVLDIMMYDVNGLWDAFQEVMEKEGEDHWTALLAIVDTFHNPEWIAQVNEDMDKSLNYYKANTIFTTGSGKELQDRIDAFNATYSAANLGIYYQSYKDQEDAIEAALTAIKDAIAATDTYSGTDETTQLIAEWEAKIAELAAQQTELENAVAPIFDDVAVVMTTKSGLLDLIDKLQTTLDELEAEYLQTNEKLGQRTPDVQTQETEIESDLGKLRDKVDVVNDEWLGGNQTAKVGTSSDDWAEGDISRAADSDKTKAIGGITFVESTNAEAVATTGTVLTQTITGLPDGKYKVELYAFASQGTAAVGDTESVEVFANDKTQPVAVTAAGEYGIYTIDEVEVTGGTLTIGLRKLKGGTQSHGIQIKSLTGISTATILNGYQEEYNVIAGREAALEALIAQIAADVAANNDMFDKASKAITDLQGWEVDELKDLAVTDSEGNYDPNKDGVQKTEPTDPWYLFKDGLDADATYAARKAAIDKRIQDLLTAVRESYGNETLPSDWNEGIGNNTIASIKADIAALKNAVEAEVDNYAAYSATMTSFGELVDAINAVTGIEEKAGAGAKDFYTELLESYKDASDDLVSRIAGSVNGRSAVADKDSFIAEIEALKAKVNAILTDAAANLAKYLEQKDEWTATQNDWNEAYAKIANEPDYDGGDTYKSRQEYLDALAEIQGEIDAAGIAVEGNYADGKAVAGASEIDFAAIRAKIQDLVASEGEDFIPAVAADNAAHHATFTTALDLAQQAFDEAVAALAANSSSNIDIAAAIYDLTHAYADALDAYRTQLDDLAAAESDAYLSVTSPAIYDNSNFLQDITDLQADIVATMNTFVENAVNQVKGFWNNKVGEYNQKVAEAEAAIAAYSDEAKKDAFKDVKDIIAKGSSATTLKAVEEAVAALEDIDGMLAADINNAAKKDIQQAMATVDVSGDRESLEAYGDYADLDAFEQAAALIVQAQTLTSRYFADGTLAAGRDDILALISDYNTIVSDLLAEAENNKVADEANTAAYDELIAALEAVQEQLADAQGLVGQFKYMGSVSFATNEQALAYYAELIETLGKSGRAVSGKDNMLGVLDSQSSNILRKLGTAFEVERTSLLADLLDAKNWFNNYVAENGLDASAQGYRDRIDAIQSELLAATIPADATFDEAVEATKALLDTQSGIIALLNELGALANDAVLASLTEAINALKEQATIEGMDEWVGKQNYSGTSLAEFIAGISEELEALEAEIAAQENIAFYEDNYQGKVSAIEGKLKPALAFAAEKQAIAEAENAAFAAAKTIIDDCAAAAAAARQKVETYNINDYAYLINSVDVEVMNAYDELDDWHQNMSSANFDAEGLADNINSVILNYLDLSARGELRYQVSQLNSLLSLAIPTESQRFSPAQWAKVIAQKQSIQGEISTLWAAIRTAGDAQFADYMQTINDIKDEIDMLSALLDDMVLLNGDANGDDRVDVLDYQLVANWILDPSKQPQAGSNIFTVVDVNENEAIEVGDLTGIVNIIMNKQWDGTNYGVKAYDSTRPESVKMSVARNQDGTGRIAISLDNFRDYTAFQLDVTLPEGMTIVSKELSSRAADSHNLWSRRQQDGSVRFLASSVTGDIFSGAQGDVLYINVKMEPSYKGGEIQVNNILFSDVTSASYGFVLGDNATDIATVGTIESLKRQVYDLGGRLMDGIRKGINIIRKADGTVEKRMVK